MGQRETAAPMFPTPFDHPRQLENASNRHRLSAVCQSESRPFELQLPDIRPLVLNRRATGQDAVRRFCCQPSVLNPGNEARSEATHVAPGAGLSRAQP